MATSTRDLKRVLVVDDDLWLRSALRDLLELEGYAVLEASNGWSALRLAGLDDPHLILLDLMLPEMSGLDVLRGLKDNVLTRRIPVIVVTAYAEMLSQADVQQADGVIQKPFSRDDLLAQVRRAAATGQSPPVSVAGRYPADAAQPRLHARRHGRLSASGYVRLGKPVPPGSQPRRPPRRG